MDDAAPFWPGTNGEAETKFILDKFSITVTCLTCGAAGVWYKVAGAIGIMSQPYGQKWMMLQARGMLSGAGFWQAGTYKNQLMITSA